MIELRWLEYESYQDPVTGEGFVVPSTYRKLQYRNAFGWNDVPVERDERDDIT